MLFDEKANREAYNFWAKKTRARIYTSGNATLMHSEPPHTFGTKRPSLEQEFYDQFTKDNVDVIDIKANPIVEIKPEGILTSDSMLHEHDVIALATDFDTITGGEALSNT